MSKEIIATDQAPAAVGPYSQAVKAGGFIFASGQIPLDPASGQLLTGDIQEQTRRCLKNLAAVLEAAGSSMAKVVKVTVFLADMGNFTAMNQAYSEFFGDAPPPGPVYRWAGCPRTRTWRSSAWPWPAEPPEPKTTHCFAGIHFIEGIARAVDFVMSRRAAKADALVRPRAGCGVFLVRPIIWQAKQVDYTQQFQIVQTIRPD